MMMTRNINPEAIEWFERAKRSWESGLEKLERGYREQDHALVRQGAEELYSAGIAALNALGFHRIGKGLPDRDRVSWIHQNIGNGMECHYADFTAALHGSCFYGWRCIEEEIRHAIQNHLKPLMEYASKELGIPLEFK